MGWINDSHSPLDDLIKECDVYQKRMNDKINPSYYKKDGLVECIDAIEACTANKRGIEAVCVAQVLKYLWRYEAKNGIEDVQKAKWYLDKLLDTLSKNTHDETKV